MSLRLGLAERRLWGRQFGDPEFQFLPTGDGVRRRPIATRELQFKEMLPSRMLRGAGLKSKR
jgi:hypothetical protein